MEREKVWSQDRSEGPRQESLDLVRPLIIVLKTIAGALLMLLLAIREQERIKKKIYRREEFKQLVWGRKPYYQQ